MIIGKIISADEKMLNFFDLVLKHSQGIIDVAGPIGEYVFEKNDDTSVKVTKNGVTSIKNIVPICEYNEDTHLLTWTSTVLRNMFHNDFHNVLLEESRTPIRELFECDAIYCDDSRYVALPYLIVMIAANSFNLIISKTTNDSGFVYQYIMVNLGVDNKVNLDEFKNELNEYFASTY